MFEPVDVRHLEILGFERYQERVRRATGMWPVCKSRPQSNPFLLAFCRSMAWTGRKLTALGWILQERFGQASPASVV